MESDRIELRGLRVLARCGILPHEIAQDQPFEVDLVLAADLAPAGASDELADTIDYGHVCDRVVNAVHAEPVALLEHLATRIAEAALAADSRVNAVTVSLRKLRPPVPHVLTSAGVTITRRS